MHSLVPTRRALHAHPHPDLPIGGCVHSLAWLRPVVLWPAGVDACLSSHLPLAPRLQFGFQEPGTNEEIKAFAADKGFRGLLMDKINVNGSEASPVYNFLKLASGDTSPILWNFVSRGGDRLAAVVLLCH